MAVSYNRLYKVLEDKNVTMVELRKAADIAPNTMTRIRKNEEVSLDVLGRISILMLIMDMKSISIFYLQKMFILRSRYVRDLLDGC